MESEKSHANSQEQTNGSETAVEEDNELTVSRKSKLAKWINKMMRIEMTDGRILIGTFVCTDKDANIILATCSELYNADKTGITDDEARMLGLVMVPGRHIVSIHVESITPPSPPRKSAAEILLSLSNAVA